MGVSYPTGRPRLPFAGGARSLPGTMNQQTRIRRPNRHSGKSMNEADYLKHRAEQLAFNERQLAHQAKVLKALSGVGRTLIHFQQHLNTLQSMIVRDSPHLTDEEKRDERARLESQGEVAEWLHDLMNNAGQVEQPPEG
jgi:hypothetical protein